MEELKLKRLAAEAERQKREDEAWKRERERISSSTRPRGVGKGRSLNKQEWTPGHDKILIDMLHSGASFSEIADKLGRSRGSVAGRARRVKEE